MKPYVGLTVHYQSYGTPNGEFEGTCRSAIITEADPDSPEQRVGLCAINPTGAFFHPLSAGGCKRSEARRPGGSWHLADERHPITSGPVHIPVTDAAAIHSHSTQVSELANSIGYALADRGVEFTAEDALAAAARAFEQGTAPATASEALED